MATKNAPTKREEKRTYWTEGEGLLEVKKWVDDGLFDHQIAKNIGISRPTLIDWKAKYKTFNTVFTVGRRVAVLEIVSELVKSAKGYYVQEQVLDNKGNKRVVRKWVPGSVPAQIFLAKNWAPEEYKDKRDMNFESALPVVLCGDDEVED